VVTLEYGPDHDQMDPFDISVPRIPENDAAAAHDASYLHPVVRAHRDGQVIAVHHLAENLENHWNLRDVHVEPLIVFVKGVLADAPAMSAPPGDPGAALSAVDARSE